MINRSPGLLYLFVVLFLGNCQNKEQTQEQPLPEVKVVEVKQQKLPIYEYFVGQIYGQEDVAINARVEGYLTGIHFEEGSRVEKGQLLYSIDQAPFLEKVANEKSKVAEARTRLVNAENELARYQPLAEINAVSKSDLDFAIASRDAALAALEAAKAGLRMAEINLSYTRIKSPITGFIGKTLARVGEFVGRSPSPVLLNTVSKIDRVRVQFFITETQYLHIVKEALNRGANEEEETTDGVSLILADGSEHPYHGKIDFANREVDPQTGTMLIQASFPNPELLLRPGQFARVKVLMETVDNALIVPLRCLSELQGRYSAFVVGADSVVQVKQVQVGRKMGDVVQITDGLQAGDKIIIEGLQMAGNGVKVKPITEKFESKATDL